jgi:hypothetical protein
VIGGTLGALTTQWRAVAIVCVLMALFGFLQHSPTVPLWLRDASYFLGILGANPQAIRPSIATFDILRTVDNLLYATVVFIIGAAILERRDVPTRGT